MDHSENVPENPVEISTGRRNGFFAIRTFLALPHPRETVFAFFADARNLERITPPWLRFKIVSPLPIFMRKGALIDYRLRLHGIPLRWRSEITVWDPPRRFVDEQRHGPYRAWIHEHTFAESGNSCEVHDHVEYSVIGGWLANSLLVKRDVRRIFSYRAQTLKRIFQFPD